MSQIQMTHKVMQIVTIGAILVLEELIPAVLVVIKLISNSLILIINVNASQGPITIKVPHFNASFVQYLSPTVLYVIMLQPVCNVNQTIN